jgi:hypothetical protein
MSEEDYFLEMPEKVDAVCNEFLNVGEEAAAKDCRSDDSPLFKQLFVKDLAIRAMAWEIVRLRELESK